MKYLDEFSDPDLARHLLDQIHAVTTAAMGDHGGVRRPDALHHPARDRPVAAGRHRDDPRPRLPGLRHPTGDHRQGAGDRGPPGRHLLLVRRHAPGPGQQQRPVPDQERGRRRPGGLLAAGRLETGPGEPRPSGGLLRHRLRDHGTRQRDDRLPGQAAGHRELLAAGLARAGAARDRGDHGGAGLPGSGVPGRGPRLQRDGHGRVPAAGRAGTQSRSWSPGSSRWTSWRASGARCCNWSPAGTNWRTRTRGRSPPGATPPRRRCCAPSSR